MLVWCLAHTSSATSLRKSQEDQEPLFGPLTPHSLEQFNPFSPPQPYSTKAQYATQPEDPSQNEETVSWAGRRVRLVSLGGV